MEESALLPFFCGEKTVKLLIEGMGSGDRGMEAGSQVVVI